jgi:group I intron endonuclease
MSQVYLLYNTANAKYYVGQTKISVQRRWCQHNYFAQNQKYAKGRSHLAAAIRKYGKESFDLSILNDVCQTQQELNECEKLWIRILQADNPKFGYNLGAGGEGVTLTPAVIEKMRFAKLGRVLTMEQCQKLSNAQKGKHHRKGQIAWNKGKHCSETTKQKLRVTSTGNQNCVGFKHSDIARQHMSKAHLGQKPWNKGQKVNG